MLIKIDYTKETINVNFADVFHEFNFSKFHRQTRAKEFPSKDEIIGLASNVVPPTDPLEQYLLDHEDDMHKNERNGIDKMFFDQPPILKHNFPIEPLAGPPPPKGDPVFELKIIA